MNKKTLSERDICTKFITPALEKAGWDGTYTVDKEKGMVIHHVTGGTIPEYINSDQRRPYILKNDTLVIGDNKTWKRVLIRVD